MIGARQHAVENEGHVLVFKELSDGEHATGRFGFEISAFGIRTESLASLGWTADGGCPHMSREICDLFGQGEDAGLARDL
jgi:hypothetical protein